MDSGDEATTPTEGIITVQDEPPKATSAHKLAEIQYDAPEDPGFMLRLTRYVDGLRKELGNSKEELTQAVKLLLRIIRAILENPYDSSKRSIRLANPRFKNEVSRHKYSMDVLLSIGFNLTPDKIYMPAVCLSKLMDAYYLLNCLLYDTCKERVPPPKISIFNPYAEKVTWQRGNLLSKIYSEGMKESKFTEDEVSRLKETLKQGGATTSEVPLNPKFYSGAARIPSINPNTQNELVEDELLSDATPSISSRSSSIAKKIQKSILHGPDFRSRKQIELDSLRNRIAYSKCTLKIRFPDKDTLELDFSPKARIRQVKQCLAQYLESWTLQFLDNWTLHVAPPYTLLEDDKTLHDQNLPPGSILYFKIRDLAETDAKLFPSMHYVSQAVRSQFLTAIP